MDDDAGDWFSEAAEEPAKTEEAAPAGAAGTGAPEAQPEAAAAEGQPKEEAQEAVDEYLDPDKLLLFKHWIRPKFLQYSYLYNYRKNYYDDVIDYLDKRQKGLSRDIPRAQTWAERVLRSSTNKSNREEFFRKAADDIRLVSYSKLSGAFFHYHTKQYVNRRYFTLLY